MSNFINSVMHGVRALFWTAPSLQPTDIDPQRTRFAQCASRILYPDEVHPRMIFAKSFALYPRSILLRVKSRKIYYQEGEDQ